jgi:hypothetical protein
VHADLCSATRSRGTGRDWDIGVGVFPGAEEVLVGRFGLHHVTLKRVGAAKAEMRKIVGDVARIDATVGENFLIFGSGFHTILQLQVGFGKHEINVEKGAATELVRDSDFEVRGCLGRVVMHVDQCAREGNSFVPVAKCHGLVGFFSLTHL